MKIHNTNTYREKVGVNQAVKIFLVLFLISLSYLAITVRSIYPLRLTQSEGYLSQIPITFWIILCVTLFVLCVLALMTNRNALSLLFTVCFYLLFSSYEFIFRGLFGGDYTVSDRHIMLEFTTVDPAVHFDYLQWPSKYILFRTQHLVLDIDDVLLNIELIFLLMVTLFSISVWYFSYSYISIPMYIFASSALFLVIVYSFLNFQSVPQFFALILLVFLFAVHNRNGKNWIFVKLTIFIALALSHPMLYIFYIGSVLLYPSFKGIWDSFDEVTNEDSQQLYLAFISALRLPRTTRRSALRHSYETVTDRRWIFYTSLIMSIYFLFYLYRFISWQTTMIGSMLLEPEGHTIAFIERILELVGIRSADPSSNGEITTQAVYYLTTTDVSSYTSSISILLVAAVGGLLLILFLLNNYSDIQPFHMAIFAAAFGYFIFGMIFDILGMRSFQILFLPFIGSLVVLERVDDNILLVLVIVLLTTSPILVANSLDNATRSAGHSTGDYYTEESGQWIEQYGSTPVLQARSTAHPIETTYDHDIENSWQSFGDRDTYILESNTTHLIQFDYRLYHSAYYFQMECNFDEQSVIYTNGNPVMWDPGGKFTCNPIE